MDTTRTTAPSATHHHHGNDGTRAGDGDGPPVAGDGNVDGSFSSAVLMNHRHRSVRHHPTLDHGVDLDDGRRFLRAGQQADPGMPPEWPDEGPQRIRQSATHLLQSWETSTRVLRRCLSGLKDPKAGASACGLSA